MPSVFSSPYPSSFADKIYWLHLYRKASITLSCIIFASPYQGTSISRHRSSEAEGLSFRPLPQIPVPRCSRFRPSTAAPSSFRALVCPDPTQRSASPQDDRCCSPRSGTDLCCEICRSLVYRESSRTARATQRNLFKKYFFKKLI